MVYVYFQKYTKSHYEMPWFACDIVHISYYPDPVALVNFCYIYFKMSILKKLILSQFIKPVFVHPRINDPAWYLLAFKMLKD